ncbi:Hsp20/alpha crystallin family protein, partial [Streptomyces massasporeus]
MWRRRRTGGATHHSRGHERPAGDRPHTVEEGLLTLRAERTGQTTEKHRTEFRHGTFARAVRLPAGARGDEATAEYEDGVLTITVPVPAGEDGNQGHPGAARLRAAGVRTTTVCAAGVT